MPWPPIISNDYSRPQIHSRVNGSESSGLTSCLNGSEYLVFTSSGGEKHGYDKWEGWHEDGTFTYTGQGQVGDQTVEKGGNRTLLEANANGKPIHLFSETKPKSRLHRYMGQVVLNDPAYQWRIEPDDNGDLRKLVVFSFIPIDTSATIPVPEDSFRVTEFSEWQPPASDDFYRSSTAGGRASREEHKLQAEFGNWLRSRGNVLRKLKIAVPGSSILVEPDLVDDSERLVIEAKASAARVFVRTAIGQVLDYCNLLSMEGREYSPAILLPASPSTDLCELLKDIGITLIIKDPTGFSYIRV